MVRTNDINMNLLNCELQNKYDLYVNKQMSNSYMEEELILKRSVFMNNLIRIFKQLREDKDKNNKMELSVEDHQKIKEFKEEIWPSIQERYKGIITDDNNPFNQNINLEKLNINDLDKIIDSLLNLHEQEQYSLTHLMTKLKQLTDDSYLLTSITTATAQFNSANTFVKNQRTQ